MREIMEYKKRLIIIDTLAKDILRFIPKLKNIVSLLKFVPEYAEADFSITVEIWIKPDCPIPSRNELHTRR